MPKTSIAFNLPRTVTAAAGGLLTGLAVTHLYVLATGYELPGYFAVYCVALAVCCALAAAIMWLDVNRVVPQLGWLAGAALCTAFAIGYLLTRASVLPGLPALTGRWDLAPGSLALACAAGFLGLYLTVLTGINVAFGQCRGWYD